MFSYQPSYYTTSPFDSFFVQPEQHRRAALLQRQRELEAARIQEARRAAALQRQREIEAYREEQQRLAEARRIQQLRRQQAEARARDAYMRQRRPSSFYEQPMEEDEEEEDESYSQHPFFPFLFGPNGREQRRQPARRSSSPHEHEVNKSSSPLSPSAQLPDSSPKSEEASVPVSASTASAAAEPVPISVDSPPKPTYSARHHEAATLIQSLWRSYATRKHALSQISSFRSSFQSLSSAFTFPSTIDFLDSATSTNPRLAYTPNNRPILAFEDASTKLLTQLDAVDSAGDDGVRAARKALVLEIEAALRGVEEKKVEAWRAQYASRVVEPVEAQAQAIEVADEAMSEVEAASSAVDIAEEPVSVIEDCAAESPVESVPAAIQPEIATATAMPSPSIPHDESITLDPETASEISFDDDESDEAIVSLSVSTPEENDTDAIMVDEPEEDADEDEWVDASDELPGEESMQVV